MLMYKLRTYPRLIKRKLVSSSFQCSCGKSVIVADGPALFSAYFHQPEYRHNKSLFHGSAFNIRQLSCTNIVRSTADSKLLCSCGKKEVIGFDAMQSEGYLALNQECLQSNHNSPLHTPCHHLYYSQRVQDVTDNLPKWSGAVGSQLISQHLNKESPLPLFTDYPISSHPLAPKSYTHPFADPASSISLPIPDTQMDARVSNKYIHSSASVHVTSTHYDVIIIGAGHNALTTAAYLAKGGLKPLVLERRSMVGGAAVTEEIVPGFLFSRASYLAGLLRPQVISELDLESFGFQYIPRDPSSFTPTLPTSSYQGKHLLLGSDSAMNYKSIAQFSVADAEAYGNYEEYLNDVRCIVDPLLDMPPMLQRSVSLRTAQLSSLARVAYQHGRHFVSLCEIMTSSACELLDRYFESDILKATLVTDAIIGSLISPRHPGSGYVLLHHVMGQAAGSAGTWAYVKGGMGGVSDAIAAKAKAHGAEICTDAAVKRILVENGSAVGVEMMDGQRIFAKRVVSGATPYHTYIELLPSLTAENSLPDEFIRRIRNADYSCGSFKINLAVDALPDFLCCPNQSDGSSSPHHRCTIHFESSMYDIERAYHDAAYGIPASRPVIEMTIPSVLDPTLAPQGQHVVQLFVQYAPYDVDPKVGHWADDTFKNAFADRVIAIVDRFCPGFAKTIIGRDILSPLDLEKIFGLHKGSITHGALSLSQLGFMRPVPGYADYRSPLKNLYLCGAGCHPGGGVMGAAGRNCAHVILGDLK